MRYRINQKTQDKISEIGLGSAYMPQTPLKEAIPALRQAYEGGINYYDLAAGDGKAFPMYGEAFKDVRISILYQIHFGADYSKGTYGWSLNLDTVKRSIEKQLKELRTDYIDYGFIHCQDEFSDWETYRKNGVYDYILKLKEQGIVRHIGLSSHTPDVIQRILDDAEVDMLMFSVNPAYDYGQGEYANGGVDERNAIYRRCEKEGIGISVMKPFSGGQLLDARQSPFGQALTEYQCIRYALDRPGVLTVLPGAQSIREIEKLLAYENQPEETLDYSIVGSFALVNKYYDLAKAGDKLAVEHYKTLEKNAADCIQCGHCDSRCPFSVRQSERMQEIRAFMI